MKKAIPTVLALLLGACGGDEPADGAEPGPDLPSPVEDTTVQAVTDWPLQEPPPPE